MNKNDLNFIGFRSELIELLNKYRYELSGTGFDDGSMRVEDIRGKKVYLLRDSYSDYEALDDDWNTLPTDYMINMFQEEHTIPFHNGKIGVFTNNRDKASAFFENLYNQNKENVERFRQSKDQIDLSLKDETYYTWIKPLDSSRGHKCSKAFIDKNITLNELNCIIVPICAYCTRGNITVI